jgi:excisionase family DNA binding protein
MDRYKKGGKIYRITKRFRVSRRTVYRWLQAGEDLERIYSLIMEVSEWFKVGEIAEVMNVSVSTIHRLYDEDMLEGLKIGGVIRFPFRAQGNVSIRNTLEREGRASDGLAF